MFVLFYNLELLFVYLRIGVCDLLVLNRQNNVVFPGTLVGCHRFSSFLPQSTKLVLVKQCIKKGPRWGVHAKLCRYIHESCTSGHASPDRVQLPSECVSDHVVGVEVHQTANGQALALERLGKVGMPKFQGVDVEGASVLLTSDMLSNVSERLHLRGMFKQDKAEPDVSMWCSSCNERIKNTCFSRCLVVGLGFTSSSALAALFTELSVKQPRLIQYVKIGTF